MAFFIDNYLQHLPYFNDHPQPSHIHQKTVDFLNLSITGGQMVQDYYSIQVLSYNNPQLCGTHFMTAQEHDVSAIPQISPGQQERFLDEGSHYGINQNLHDSVRK